MKYFHPSDTCEIGVQRGQIDNFALWFTRFLPLQQGKKTKEYKFELHDADAPKLSDNSLELLRALQDRQKARLDAFEAQGRTFTVRRGTVDWRMVIGLGGAHVLETSMTLHHVYGIPYIPGSAVKGMVRHYFISEILAPKLPEEALDVLDAVLLTIDDATLRETTDPKTLRQACKVDRGKDKEPGFPDLDTVRKVIKDREILQQGQTIFGTQHQRGVVVFLDALPEGDVQFQKDLMNPHYPEYYKEKTPAVPPNDCQNPIPIPFLTLQQTRFNFPLLVDPLPTTIAPDTLLETVVSWLCAALEDEGIGAKSAVGYGYFRDVADQQAERREQAAEAQQQADQQAAAEAERARLESLSPVEKLCEELRTLKDENRSFDIYNEELSKYEGEEQKQLAQAIKTYWQSIDRWGKDISKKQKDKVAHIKAILGE